MPTPANAPVARSRRLCGFLSLLLLGTLAIVHLLVPQMILAWSEPDPVREDAAEPYAEAR